MRPSNAFEPLDEACLELPLQRRFEQQVARAPGRPALWTEAGELSYAALDRWSERIAGAIAQRLGPEPAPVALCFCQGPGSVAAILGTLKARKFWVPLDPRAALEECERVLDDSGAQLLLTDRAHADRARALARRIPQIELEDCDSGAPDARCALEASADDLAYVFYTSGSTGRPKGVCDTHRNVIHNVLRYTNSLHLCREDRLSLIQACTFSGTVSSLFGALLNGACLLPFDFTGSSPARLADWIERARPTVYHSVPAIFRSLFAAGPRSFPSLRLIRLEGDQASARDLELFQRHFADSALLVNGLGTTETGLVAQHFVARGDRVAAEVVPVGRAVEGIELRVVDPLGRACAAGEIGEIEVESRHLARGYWRRPELTRERFRARPDAAAGTRAYRTGDLGRMRLDGCLEHLGRLDARVKLRGQWVELAQVEARLHALDGVKEAVVAVERERLVAYLVPAAHPAPPVSELRRSLEQALPLTWVPGRLVWLDALPLSPSGKLDRAALLATGSAARRRELVAPRDLVELRLVQLWEEVLELEAAGAGDDFFELGGDSLRALLLLDALEESLGPRMPPDVLLESRTPEALAARLRSGANVQPLIPVQPGRPGTPPFYFLHGDYSSGGLYCHALARQLGSDLPFFALTPCGVAGDPLPESYAAMAQRHLEVLRAAAPRGPYRLGGNCNGGLVAFELARLLEARGEKVERLVLISASAANLRFAPLRTATERLGRAVGAAPAARRALFRRLREFALRLEALPPRARLPRALRSAAAKLPGALADLLRPVPGSAPAPQGSREPRDRSAVRQHYQRIDAEYVPRRHAGPVCVIWPETDPEPAEQAAARWRQLCAQLVLRRVPGTHTTCLTRHVGALAAQVRACLD